MRRSIELLFRGRRIEIGDAATARMTMLEWLRTRQGAVGTKEGCAEGDCGACTVVLVRPEKGSLSYNAVNACIMMIGQADGAAVLTIEDLATREGGLHPVQTKMIAHHGAQCGFCTPGIVMSLFALHEGGSRPLTRAAVLDQLAGNLCRCTGYRPIIEAALAASMHPAVNRSGLRDQLAAIMKPDVDVFAGDEASFFAAPASETTLQVLLANHSDAVLIAGATDAGLWLTKELRQPQKVIWLGRVAGLDAIEFRDGKLSLGATVPLQRALSDVTALAPDLGEVMRRFGSVQVRNSGTVGGSIANASPIGDLAPCMIALDATLELGSVDGKRTMPLERYFLAYKQQDRRAGEYLRRLTVPMPAAGVHFRAYKVSKRLDEDIASVLGAFALTIEGRRVTGARIAFGGMAGIPARAVQAEAAITGADLDDPATWESAIAALTRDFTPLDDHRASAAYRRLVAGNLLSKALMELAGVPATDLRLTPVRGAAHAG